jgi:hypothetical protein
MRTALRVAATIIGIIGAVDGLVIDFVVSAFRRAQDILGGTADPSHGFIGLVICLVGLAGALLVLRSPLVGGILLILAGIAFFVVVHWWALLASPQLIVGGAVALMELNESRAGHPRL